ncbi:MAG: hypothetical protein GY940_37875 [bacterium]|nr:hypothetical protein [bacterium]
MKKIVILLIIAAFLVFAGPKILESLLGLFGGKDYDMSGTWEIEYTIYDKADKGIFEFGKADGDGKGSVSSGGAIVGSYELAKRNVIFTVKFMDIERDKLNAEFRGVIQSDDQMDVMDSIQGTLKGTRTVKGITVDTEGDWSATRM